MKSWRKTASSMACGVGCEELRSGNPILFLPVFSIPEYPGDGLYVTLQKCDHLFLNFLRNIVRCTLVMMTIGIIKLRLPVLEIVFKHDTVAAKEKVTPVRVHEGEGMKLL